MIKKLKMGFCALLNNDLEMCGKQLSIAKSEIF